MTALDISRDGKLAGKQRLAFVLPQVMAHYKETPLKVARFKALWLFSVTTEKREALGLSLITEFEPESLAALQAEIPELSLEQRRYAWEMKPEVFDKYQREFLQHERPEALLMVGDKAALRLEHFELVGPAQIEAKTRQETMYPEANADA